MEKEQSVTAAAEYLNITQPTLFRQFTELEDRLGVTLFICGSREITLTNDGIRLHKRAEEILSLVNKTKAEFRNHSEIVGGDIYLY